MRRYILVCLTVALFPTSLLAEERRLADEATWQAGLAKVVITPQEPMWMSGYGPRLANEKLHDLWIKVLAIQAPDGHRAVVITSDVCGFSKLAYETLCTALKERCGLERQDVMLTCSHTHTGPALRECLHVCWPWENPETRVLVEKYSLDLEARIVTTVEQALASLAPANLYATEGTADFAVNRRNNKEVDVPTIRQRGEALKGPVDHSIPMLVVRSCDGTLKCVLFGYACHSTTLATKEWSGDYAGFAMLALERGFPGTDALFFQGCGADQNPIPRGSVDICRKYGELLATGVETALSQPMREIKPSLATAFDFVELEFKRPLTPDYLAQKSQEKSPWGALSQRYLDQLHAGKSLATTHPYAIQVWKLGGEQLWISLSGEVVVDYSLNYKAKYGPTTWVNGFAHDLVCYVPSTRVLHEGGGQEVGVPWAYGLPAEEWAEEIEARINTTVDGLVQNLAKHVRKPQ